MALLKFYKINKAISLSRNKSLRTSLFLFFFIPIFLNILVFPSAYAEEKPVGQIIGIIGSIEYRTAETPVANTKGDGKVQKVSFSPWQKAKFKQKIYARDEFRTARNSRLKIKFSDNSVIALGPNAKMEVERYLFEKGEKLRQGVVNVSQGLSMYIFNKSQNNKKSSFKIKSPSGNLVARGTHGYIAVTSTRTLVGNRAGSVLTTSSDPTITKRVRVDAMKKTIIAKGKPPTPQVDMTRAEVNLFDTLVTGSNSAAFKSGKGKKSLIEVEETAEDEEEEKKKEKKKKRRKTKKAKKAKKNKKSSDNRDSSEDSKESKTDSDTDDAADDSDDKADGKKADSKDADASDSDDKKSDSKNAKKDNSDSDSTDSSAGADSSDSNADSSDSDGSTDSSTDSGDSVGETTADASADTSSSTGTDDGGSVGGTDSGGVDTAGPDTTVAAPDVGGDIGGDFTTALAQDFGGETTFGTSADYGEVNQPFSADVVSACSN